MYHSYKALYLNFKTHEPLITGTGPLMRLIWQHNEKYSKI